MCKGNCQPDAAVGCAWSISISVQPLIHNNVCCVGHLLDISQSLKTTTRCTIDNHRALCPVLAYSAVAPSCWLCSTRAALCRSALPLSMPSLLPVLLVCFCIAPVTSASAQLMRAVYRLVPQGIAALLKAVQLSPLCRSRTEVTQPVVLHGMQPA